MFSLRYSITFESPVIISVNSGEANMTETYDFIPGSTILGILASKYIKNKNIVDAHKDEGFYNLFLNGGIIFSNTYLALKENSEVIPTTPMPFSIQKGKNSEEIYNLAYNEVDEQTKPLNSYGFLRNDKVIYDVPRKKINFHHYRKSRLKGHSEKNGGIFNYEYLTSGQVFIGEIYGDEGDLKEIKSLFKDKFHINIGRSHNAEYGSAVMELYDIAEIDKDFFSDLSFEDEILLTFTSPCILLNEYGYSEVSKEILAKYLKKIFDKYEFEIENCWIKTVFIETYLSVWKMKKPSVNAFDKGSAIKIKFTKDINDEILNELYRLKENGIGERVNEGYGQFNITGITEEKYIEVTLNTEVKKPTGTIPEIAKDIFTFCIENEIEKKIELDAINNVSSFKLKQGFGRESKLPQNSLLGRLLSFIEDSDKKSFTDKISKLRDTAKRQLDNCNNGDYTLYDFINKKEDMITKYLDDDAKLKRLSQAASFDIEKEDKFRKSMYRFYWTTFFREMRMLNKSKSIKE